MAAPESFEKICKSAKNINIVHVWASEACHTFCDTSVAKCVAFLFLCYTSASVKLRSYNRILR